MAGIATAALHRGKTLQIDHLHNILGHPSEDTTRKTAEFYRWNVNGKFTPCEDCGIAKAWQKNVNKETETRSIIRGERVFIDISSIQQKSFGGSKFWLLVIDDCTDFCWSAF
jgi:hypothetical protein